MGDFIKEEKEKNKGKGKGYGKTVTSKGQSSYQTGVRWSAY